MTDHINGNGLDNRRLNMRPVQHRENAWNSIGQMNTRSRFKGVDWHAAQNFPNKWRARIMANGKRKELGHFGSEEEAALAYNKAAQEKFGEYARLNVIEG